MSPQATCQNGGKSEGQGESEAVAAKRRRVQEEGALEYSALAFTFAEALYAECGGDCARLAAACPGIDEQKLRARHGEAVEAAAGRAASGSEASGAGGSASSSGSSGGAGFHGRGAVGTSCALEQRRRADPAWLFAGAFVVGAYY
jgi:hypothetical protein